MAATTTPSTATPLADRGATVAYTAQPRTLAERLRYLRQDAARILAAPEAFTPAERSWAMDMLDAGAPAATAETRKSA